MSVQFQPPEGETPKPAGPPASFRTDPAMWRSYVVDLIYAAATGPASYAAEIARRRRPMTPEETDRARASGEAMRAELRRMHPDAAALGIVRLARAATGEDEPTQERQRQRFAATVACCARWLPKNPAGRPVRPGGTPEERQARADQLVAQIEDAAKQESPL